MCNVAFLQMAQVVAGAAGQAKQMSAVAGSALASQNASNAMFQDREHQIDAQATDQMTDRAKAAMKTQGTLNAIFADSGVSGNTQDRIANEAAGSAVADQTTIERNRAAKITQTQAEISAEAARTQSTINSVRHASALGTGLQIAGIGANEYDRTHPRSGTSIS